MCNICKDRFPSVEKFNEHTFNRTLNLFVCCKCTMKSASERIFNFSLQIHKKSTTNSGLPNNPSGKSVCSLVNNMFTICKYGDAPYSDISVYYIHSKTHTNENEPRKELKTQLLFQNDPNRELKIRKLYNCITYKCAVCEEGFLKANRNRAIEHLSKCKNM